MISGLGVARPSRVKREPRPAIGITSDRPAGRDGGGGAVSGPVFLAARAGRIARGSVARRAYAPERNRFVNGGSLTAPSKAVIPAAAKRRAGTHGRTH
jgi:hypothetical protein